jgi:hypothetical protein
MTRLLAAILALLMVAGLAVLALGGCESADNAAARRASEEAARVRAEAEAYQQRQAADVQAAAERAAIREAARQAGHERALETLPYVLAIGGGLLLAGLGLLLFWDLRRQAQPAGTDPALLLYLDRLRLQQAEQWRAIATLARRSLPSGDEGEVIIYSNRQR